MKPEHVIEGLRDVAQQLGIQVRMEKGSFRGGRCVVSGEEVIVLNRHHIPELQISILAEGLRDEAIDQVYMRPALRRALEDAWSRVEDVPASEDEADA